MRKWLIVALSAGLLAALPLGAAESDEYIVKNVRVGKPRTISSGPKQGIFVTVRFEFVKPEGVKATDKDYIVILEEEKEVKRIPIEKAEVQSLTTVLTLASGSSMASGNKIAAARAAAGVFLDNLNNRADTGLILFNQQVPFNDPTRFLQPCRDPGLYKQQSDRVRALINAVKPDGGAAYRDATEAALDMLNDLDGNKNIVLMTDGFDLNSKHSLADVIKKAKVREIPVHTLGIGDSVTTVLVLDHSGSMAGPANDTDSMKKIEALQRAAMQFVDHMPSSARTTLLPFSTTVETPGPLTGDKQVLAGRIRSLQPDTGTSLYDAALAGVETLVAANVPGAKAVIVLTDGKDESPGSRYSDQAVIDRAKEAGIPLYMLGLGRKREINEPVMKRMASETGGKYYYAGSAKDLIDLFTELSVGLHDEDSLRKLAVDTGGSYHHVREVSQLQFAFTEIAKTVQKEYVEEIKSTRDRLDGTARKIEVRVYRATTKVDASGKEVEVLVQVSDKKNEAVGGYTARGLLVPEQAPVLFLVLLGGIIGLIAIPALMRMLNGTGRVR
jgi:VWFA-related protein